MNDAGARTIDRGQAETSQVDQRQIRDSAWVTMRREMSLDVRAAWLSPDVFTYKYYEREREAGEARARHDDDPDRCPFDYLLSV